MELHICGFNAHNQLVSGSKDETNQFSKIRQSLYLRVRSALWSSMMFEDDGNLIHTGFRSSGVDPTLVDSPPLWNIKAIFGDTSGVLGALTNDGSIYLFHDGLPTKPHVQFKKHHFDEDSFITKQNLSIHHVAIADNEEVCIITGKNTTSVVSRYSHSIDCNMQSGDRCGCMSVSADHTPQITLSGPTAKLEIHTFASFEDFECSKPPISTVPMSTPIVSLLAGATGFTTLTSNGEVLTFGSALHAQSLGRTPSPSHPANVPASIPSLGGIPIRKIAIGGWIGAALSEDNDLYVWGGHLGGAKRMSALPNLADGEEVKLVDIDGGVDIVDVGVGSGHIIVLTAEGRVFVAGDGDCGQLGTGPKVFEEDWVMVMDKSQGEVVEVGAGVWCSWVLMDRRRQGSADDERNIETCFNI